MKKYRVTLNVDDGWVENFNQVIEAEDEDEAWEKHEKDDYVGEEWNEVEEEYKVTDTELREDGDTPTEGVKKWREQKVISGNDYEINADGTEVK